MFAFETHEEFILEAYHLVDYIEVVSGKSFLELDIKDVNSFLNGLEDVVAA